MMAACRRLILAVALVLAAGSPVSTASAGLTIKDPVPSELQARVAGLLQDMRSGDADAAIGAARIIDGDLWRQYGLLFLRVHERLLKSVKYDHGKHFSSVLQRFGLPAERIVIELPAVAVAHKTFLGYLTRSYQHHGFKVADKTITAYDAVKEGANAAAKATAFNNDATAAILERLGCRTGGPAGRS